VNVDRLINEVLPPLDGEDKGGAGADRRPQLATGGGPDTTKHADASGGSDPDPHDDDADLVSTADLLDDPDGDPPYRSTG